MAREHDSGVSRRGFLKWGLVAGGSLAAMPPIEACSSGSAQQAAAPTTAQSSEHHT